MDILFLVSVAIICIVMASVVFMQPRGEGYTLSKYAANKKLAFWIFSLGISIFGSILVIFLFGFYGPKLHMGPAFYSLLLLCWLSMMLVIWIPDRGYGKKHTVHVFVAVILAIILTLLTVCIVLAPSVLLPIRIAAAIATVWYVYTIAYYFAAKETGKYYLLFESMNFGSFFLLIITSYLFT